MARFSKAKSPLLSAVMIISVCSALVMMLSGCGDSSSSASFDISGDITAGATSLAGVTVTITGESSRTTTTSASGHYLFSAVPNGSYTVTASRAGYVFSPPTWSLAISGRDAIQINFYGYYSGRMDSATHTVYLKADGTVWAWGLNSSGQLGDNSTTDRLIPVSSSGLSGVTAIAAGDDHTMALKSDGTVWTWGNNSNGQLGDGTIIQRNTPVQVVGLTSVKDIAGGNKCSLALKSDGTVWAWGLNNSGQLGDNSTTDRWTPVQVSGLTDVIEIASGYDHAMALKDNKTVWAWGNNSNGQLGTGTTINSSVPVQVALASATIISAGYKYSVARNSAGYSSVLWGWGLNSSGQLGIGTVTDSLVPVIASGLTGVTDVAAGYAHVVLLKNDGTVWAWGNNGKGQLGNNTTVNSSLPLQVAGLTGVVAIAAGTDNSLALKTDGSGWVWGNNSNGQLGDNSTTDRWTPVSIALP